MNGRTSKITYNLEQTDKEDCVAKLPLPFCDSTCNFTKKNNKNVSQELKYYTASCEIMSGRNKEVMKSDLRNRIVLKVTTKMPV